MDETSQVLDEQPQHVEPTAADMIANETSAVLSQKLSNKVRCQRWPGPLGPVYGPTVIIHSVDYIAHCLARSGFMEPWIEQKIKEHLLAGGTFQNRGQSKREDEVSIVPNGNVVAMQVKSEYRMATEQEVLDYVDHQEFASITGHKVSRRAQEKGYILHYHEGVDLIEKYDSLPKQAKVLLDLLNETGREKFTEASVEVILTEKSSELRTKQDPMKIWGFYRKRLIDDGHIEEVGEE